MTLLVAGFAPIAAHGVAITVAFALITDFAHCDWRTRTERARTGLAPTSTDVPDEVLAPEVIVFTTSQPAANAEDSFATVEEIAIGRRVAGKVVDILLPLRIRAATPQERSIYGLDRTARVAVFDLETLAPDVDAAAPNLVIRVSFDRVAKGSSPMTSRTDCVVPFSTVSVS